MMPRWLPETKADSVKVPVNCADEQHKIARSVTLARTYSSIRKS